MYLFCPKCQSQFPAGGQCPRCSSRLQSPVEVADGLLKAISTPPPRDHQSGIGGRFAVGCVIALGLHLGLREWTAALLSICGGQPVIEFWLGFALRVLAVIPAGLLAGAGRPSRFPVGFAIGLIVASSWLIIDPFPAFELTILRSSLALGVAVSTGILAMIGGRIWPPAMDLPVPVSPRESSLLGMTGPTSEGAKRRPTQWARILAIAMLMVIGVIMAEDIRKSMTKLPAGLVRVSGPAAARVDFEITAALIILGGIVCGSSTGRGIWHGMLTACLVVGVVLPLQATRPVTELPGIHWFLEQVSDGDGSESNVILGAALFLTITLTGWLGGQLFLPLAPIQRRRRTDCD